MNNYNATEMLAEEMMARMTAANREIDQLRAALAAAKQRAEAAEAERDQLLRHLADTDQSSMERIAQIDALEAALAAVPVDAIRRYFEHSDAYRDVRNGKYEPEQGLLDCQSIAEWLDQQLEPTP